MPFTLSAQHLAEQDGRYEPQRACNGHVRIVDRSDVAGSVQLAGIELAVESFALPKEESQVIAMRWGHEVRKVPGPTNYPALPLVVRDYIDPNVAALLRQWRSEVAQHDANTSRVGRASKFKRDAQLFLMSPDGGTERWFTLRGVWPAQIDFGDIDMSSDEVLRVRMTLEYDVVIEYQLASAATE